MFHSPETLSVTSLSRSFLPATANIPWKLTEDIRIDGGAVLPVDCHVLRIKAEKTPMRILKSQFEQAVADS
jgi:hypothetical protein